MRRPREYRRRSAERAPDAHSAIIPSNDPTYLSPETAAPETSSKKIIQPSDGDPHFEPETNQRSRKKAQSENEQDCGAIRVTEAERGAAKSHDHQKSGKNSADHRIFNRSTHQPCASPETRNVRLQLCLRRIAILDGCQEGVAIDDTVQTANQTETNAATAPRRNAGAVA